MNLILKRVNGGVCSSIAEKTFPGLVLLVMSVVEAAYLGFVRRNQALAFAGGLTSTHCYINQDCPPLEPCLPEKHLTTWG
eukprot:2355213-Amphidinium_carterae.1